MSRPLYITTASVEKNKVPERSSNVGSLEAVDTVTSVADRQTAVSKPYRILIVDDHTILRDGLHALLASESDFDVVGATADGRSAIRSASTLKPDLILMDWNMPNMTGIEAVRAIRDSGNSTPIIMVTSEAEKERVIEAVKSGANSYIIKPFSPQAIVAKLQEVLQLNTA